MVLKKVTEFTNTTLIACAQEAAKERDLKVSWLTMKAPYRHTLVKTIIAFFILIYGPSSKEKANSIKVSKSFLLHTMSSSAKFSGLTVQKIQL